MPSPRAQGAGASMMSLLVQVVSTFVALLLATIAAYAIFLWTNQTSVDADLRSAGSEISKDIAEAAVLWAPPLYTDIFLMQEYRSRFPDESDAMLLRRLASDVAQLQLAVEYAELTKAGRDDAPQSAAQSLEAVAAQGNAPGALRGRLAAWIMQQSVGTLVAIGPSPSVVVWAPGQNISLHADPGRTLFPDGALGAEAWLVRCGLTTSAIQSLSPSFIREPLIADLQSHLAADTHAKGVAGTFDYTAWWLRMEGLSQKLVAHGSRVAALVSLRESYDLDSRFRHRGWVALLGVILTAVGLALPLWLVACGQEAAVPAGVNLAITACALTLCTAIGWLVWSDLIPRQRFALVRYLKPLQSEIAMIANDGRARVSFDLSLINAIVSDKSRTGIDAATRSRVERLQLLLLESGRSSEALVRALSDALSADALILSYRGNFGGSVIPAITFIERGEAIAAAIPPGGSVSIEAERAHVSTQLLNLRIPSEESAAREVRERLGVIASKMRAQSQYGRHMESRRQLEKELPGIADWLERRAKEE